MGLARQGGPWGRSYQPETRLQEGRKGNSGRGQDKEGSHAQHNGLPQGWDFAPTWPPVCSHSVCKYLLMFIFLGRWVPSEALPMTHRSVCPRDPGSIQQGLLALFSFMQAPGTDTSGQNCLPCTSPGTLLSGSSTNPLCGPGTYGARSWVKPFCR